MNPEIKKSATLQQKTQSIVIKINNRCKKSSCKWYKRYSRFFFFRNLDPIEQVKLSVIEKGCSVFAPHRWCKKRHKADEIALRELREKRENIK
jgi:hypothetical protein